MEITVELMDVLYAGVYFNYQQCSLTAAIKQANVMNLQISL